MGCFPIGTHDCSYGELPSRQPLARRQQRVLPFQAGTFCLGARGLSPGGLIVCKEHCTAADLNLIHRSGPLHCAYLSCKVPTPFFTEFHLPSSPQRATYAFSCSSLRCRGCSLISSNALLNMYAEHRCRRRFVRVLSRLCVTETNELRFESSP